MCEMAMMLHLSLPVIQALHSALQNHVLMIAGSFHLLNPFDPERVREPSSAQLFRHDIVLFSSRTMVHLDLMLALSW